MVDNQPTEEHFRHCMLFDFRSSVNATVATKKICIYVHGDVLKATWSTVQRLVKEIEKVGNTDSSGEKKRDNIPYYNKVPETMT
ncbi:hypothetical protein NECAME_07702 [Necator americanus]|uniref:Mos1 transposase HTH domain-containing protein n=1 Tax=Necator americanus TaxID=51031 RepID=W2TMI9_NECAM|nr:hypothetical protein NECAME_07702 [Necator americanus]ETN82869.1 hypothetical protein NECAME_07702 [Necator americanus]